MRTIDIATFSVFFFCFLVDAAWTPGNVSADLGAEVCVRLEKRGGALWGFALAPDACGLVVASISARGALAEPLAAAGVHTDPRDAPRSCGALGAREPMASPARPWGREPSGEAHEATPT